MINRLFQYMRLAQHLTNSKMAKKNNKDYEHILNKEVLWGCLPSLAGMVSNVTTVEHLWYF